ncbi:MAG: uroporphyrinogen decarboxylase [Porphyromonadaceae bacterium]|nr:uroporphyrinogen decarboxylase [Porphyromonadaceae bacterium]
MDASIWTNIIGYIAMTLLVISFIPKQIKTVRIVNLIACMFFVGYGILLGWAWPIIISNVAVCCVQIYHLFFAKQKPNVEVTGK